MDDFGTIPVRSDEVFLVFMGDDLAGLGREAEERIRDSSLRTLGTPFEREVRLEPDGLPAEFLGHDDGMAEFLRNLEGALPVPAIEREILVALLRGVTFLLADDWREEDKEVLEEEVVLIVFVAVVGGVGEPRLLYLLGGLFWTIALHS